jgi:hypothetical protein
MDGMCFILPKEGALMDCLSTQPHQYKVEEDCGLEGCNIMFKHEHLWIQMSEQSGLVVQQETIMGTDKQASKAIVII